MADGNEGLEERSERAPGAEAAASPTRFLMVGCGKMGGALLEGWNGIESFSFTAISPSRSRRVPEGVVLRGSREELVDEGGDACFDHLIVAVKPQMVEDIMPQYMDLLAPGGTLISLAAGMSCATLKALTGAEYVVRVMPNLPVAIGQGVSALFADEGVSNDQRSVIEALMAPTGAAIWTFSEDELDRATAVAGSGPGYAFEFMRCWVAAAEELGFDPATARTLVLQTLLGATSMALASDASPEELRNNVTSRKGTTQAGLDALNGDGLLDSRLVATLSAAYDRACELR